MVERKDQSFIPAVQKLPTKMLCIPMSSCGNTEHVTIMFCGLHVSDYMYMEASNII